MSIYVNIPDLAPGQAYAFKFRSFNGDGYSDWSQIFRHRTTGDLVAPEAISGLTWDVVGGTFVGRWNKVIYDAQGKRLDDFKDYKIDVSNGTVTKTYYQLGESFTFGTDLNLQEFGAIMTTLTITVSARDYTGNIGVSASKTATDPIPPTPSTPVASISMGQVVVAWDGKSSTGTVMPYNFSYVEVHVSTTNNFTPSASTLSSKQNGKFQIALDALTYGTPYYIKLVAVNDLQRVSTPSAQATGTPARISGLDIQNGTISTDQINFADQIGGNKGWYQTTQPTGAKKDDLWYNTTPGMNYEVRRFDGVSTWALAPEVGVVSGTKIIAGTLTADAVGTNRIITASANIGTAVIDSTNIGSVNAGTITLGTMKSSQTAAYGGVTQPVWSVSMTGAAVFAEMNVIGQLVVGSSNTALVTNNSNVLLRSYNYLAGSAGWALKGDGSIEASSGTFRGTVSGATITGGTIAGTSITSTTTITGATITGAAISGGTITGGNVQTSASTYPRVYMDTTGLYLQSSSTTTTASFSTATGTAVVTGVFKSNYSGQRVEINSSFSNPASANPGTIYSGLRIYGATDSYFGEIGVGNATATNYYTLQMISPGATTSNGSFLRLHGSGTSTNYDSAQMYASNNVIIDSAGNTRLAGGSVTINSPSGSVLTSGNLLQFNSANGITLTATTSVQLNGSGSAGLNVGSGQVNITGVPIYFNSTYGYIAVSSTSNAPMLVFSGNSGSGALKFATFSDGYATGLSVINSSDTAYQSIRHGGIYQASDMKIKSNIVPADSMLEDVLSTPVYEYDVDATEEYADARKVKKNKRMGRRRGLLAQESPDRIRVRGSNHPEASELEKQEAVDMYAMTATAWGAVKELYAIIEGLQQEIDLLKGNS